MKKTFLNVFLALLLCAAVTVGAQAATLAELFGIEGDAPQETISASDGDPFAQAQVAVEPPIILTGETPEPDFEAIAAEETGIADSDIRDDGMVRVLLRSLKGPKTITLTLDGVYTLEHDAGFRFARGTRVVLTNVDGRIFMAVGGLTLDMGVGLTLTRQAAEGVNGLYIEESERDTLYPGDLCVTAEGGGLTCVLTIRMEDYLEGVIAYEMSDAWPVEALKSQAVAARTYALQRKRVNADEDYDVTDTTSDQVFKGVDAEYTTVAEAVRATSGVIGVAEDGSPAQCWYTASNGGRVALPSDVWVGIEDVSYVERKDDPYDVENPNSMVTALQVSADAHESEALRTLLQAALEEKYADRDAIEFDEIMSVEPVEDVPEGSRMYTKLRFTVTATALMPMPAATPEATEAAFEEGIAPVDATVAPTAEPKKERRSVNELFVVDLSVYDDIKDTLELGINSSDCELCGVTQADGMFFIEMRRYGHGVGMSQRGAQRMAGVYGKTWQEILSFYYPGMRLERVNWETPELEAVEELTDSVGAARPEPTPLPTPAPLPPLKEGEYYATISLGDDGSMMNLREAPTTQSMVITQLADGQRLIVEDKTADENGWVAVHTAEYSGYAKLNYLKRE